jgi:hypothetical protein
VRALLQANALLFLGSTGTTSEPEAPKAQPTLEATSQNNRVLGLDAKRPNRDTYFPYVFANIYKK